MLHREYLHSPSVAIACLLRMLIAVNKYKLSRTLANCCVGIAFVLLANLCGNSVDVKCRCLNGGNNIQTAAYVDFLCGID